MITCMQRLATSQVVILPSGPAGSIGVKRTHEMNGTLGPLVLHSGFLKMGELM